MQIFFKPEGDPELPDDGLPDEQDDDDDDEQEDRCMTPANVFAVPTESFS